MTPPDELDLANASDTDEINQLAAKLAAWALRQGMDPADVVDWVLDQPREFKLPRGSAGKLNPTDHHVRSGAEYAVETYDPAKSRPDYDPAPIEQLRTRIKLSNLKQEQYLLAVMDLCDKYKTYTPVITGPLLSEMTGRSTGTTGKIISGWADTYAYGLFTKVTYDGVTRHGRVWTVDLYWDPVEKATHEPGCQRGTRCTCGRNTQKGISILTADKIDMHKCVELTEWLSSLPSGTGVTVTDCCKATGLTRYKAGKRLREAEGTELLLAGTYPGGRKRKNGKWVRQGETWFTP